MGIIYWVIVGALAGWIASMIMKTDAQMGAVANIVVGIIGAVIGGWLLGVVFNFHSTNLFGNVATAIVGAVVLIAIWKAVAGRRAV